MPASTIRTAQQSAALLRDWLARTVPEADQVEISRIETPEIGYSAENIMFSARWRTQEGEHHRDLVARLRPAEYVFFPAADLEVHYRMLRALEETPVPAPRALWFQPAEGSPFDQPFFVMEALPGRVPHEYPPYTMRGWTADLDPAGQRDVFRGAVRELARVHQVDWAALDLSFLPCMSEPKPGMHAELAMFERFTDAMLDGRRFEPLEEARAWLVANVPTSDRLGLSWGDAKFSNILYEGAHPTGLLDWELASVAPPESDIAFFLVYHDSVTRSAGFGELPGFLGDDEAIELYEQIAGYPLDGLRFYRIFHLFRLAVMSLRLTDLLVQRGKLSHDSPRAPHLNSMDLLRRSLGS